MDDTNNTETELTADAAIAALEADGYDARLWKDVRIYVRQGKRDLGYIDATNLGDIDRATKTIDGRRGDIRNILRAA